MLDVTLDQIRQRVKDDPSLTFDELMESTGAGTKCTSCLLDLEYFFVSGDVPRDRNRVRRPTPKVKKSLKRRIYSFIDSISPVQPYVLRTFAPVISGEGIEEYFWIANRPMLFNDDEFQATPHRLEYTVRDKDGTVRQHDKLRIAAGECARINISDCIKRPAEELSIGSFEVRLWSERPGFRGTTRPQIEIMTRSSACSVHTQGPHRYPFSEGTNVPCRPDDDRIFLIFMNSDAKKLSGVVAVEHMTQQHAVSAPPFGAIVFEVPTSQVAAETAFVRYTMDGGCKIYMVCASRQLDRFSVDHL